MLMLVTEPLRADAFAPFGDVLAYDAASSWEVNGGWARRADLKAALDDGGADGPPVLAMFRARHQKLPSTVPFLERHPSSSQVFLALAPARFLVVVAPHLPDGAPDIARARAFLGQAGQGVNYRRGVWHAPITATDGDTDFLMLIWERGVPEDCIVHTLPAPITITEPAAGLTALFEAPHGA